MGPISGEGQSGSDKMCSGKSEGGEGGCQKWKIWEKGKVGPNLLPHVDVKRFCSGFDFFHRLGQGQKLGVVVCVCKEPLVTGEEEGK